MRLMYTPHPDDDRLSAFVPSSLVQSASNNVTLQFSELLAVRRAVESIANTIHDSQPDLIPFFATGGIPFMIPAMQILYNRNLYHLVDGTRFHRFPGLSWNGTLKSLNSEGYFVKVFGSLVEELLQTRDRITIWTMDATFTGNAIRKLLRAFQRCFRELNIGAASVAITIVGVIDASRARRVPGVGCLELKTSLGSLYLDSPSEFAPVGELIDRRPNRYERKDGKDLMDIEIEYWTVPAIPTEDRAELIGAIANPSMLGLNAAHEVGRLTVEFENGYSPVSTGGGSLANNVLGWLARPEETLPWSRWIEVASAEPIRTDERQEYAEAKQLTTGGLRIFELMNEPFESVVIGLLQKRALLEDVEVYCVKELACREAESVGIKVDSNIEKLLRKVLATAKANSDAIADAVALFRVCRPGCAAEEPEHSHEAQTLIWWETRLRAS